MGRGRSGDHDGMPMGIEDIGSESCSGSDLWGLYSPAEPSPTSEPLQPQRTKPRLQSSEGSSGLTLEIRASLESIDRKLDAVLAAAAAAPRAASPRAASPRRSTVQPPPVAGGNDDHASGCIGPYSSRGSGCHGDAVHLMGDVVQRMAPRQSGCDSLPLSSSGSEKLAVHWADPVLSPTNPTGTPVVPCAESSAVGTEASSQKEKVTWGLRSSQNSQSAHMGNGVKSWIIHSKMWVAQSVGSRRRLWKTVHGTPFQLCVSFMILLHALLTGYTAQMELATEAFGDPYQHWVDILEVCFSVFFLAELSLRLSAERLLFIMGKDWRWNIFDSILILFSMLDLVATEAGAGHSAGARVGQILRIARFLRLMRISRVMRHLTSLRTILYAILASMTSLVWCFILIGAFMYGFAVLIVYGAADFFASGSADKDEVTAEDLKRWWGSIYRAMVSLFMGISGGADWADLVQPLRGMSGLYEPMFIFYIFFMTFGVLNVVVGAFVATTSQIVDEDKEALVKLEIDRFEKYRSRIKGFFREADLDQSGTLSWDEFRRHLEDPKVKAYFQALELDVSQAHVLFDLLDTDGSDQVTIDEFLDGCMRLKGQARNVDLNMLLFTSQKLFQEWGGFMSRSEDRLAYLEQFIKGLRMKEID